MRIMDNMVLMNVRIYLRCKGSVIEPTRRLILRAELCKKRHYGYFCGKLSERMKYADYQNTLSLQMIYAGYSKVGTEWCYKNVVRAQ